MSAARVPGRPAEPAGAAPNACALHYAPGVVDDSSAPTPGVALDLSILEPLAPKLEPLAPKLEPEAPKLELQL